MGTRIFRHYLQDIKTIRVHFSGKPISVEWSNAANGIVINWLVSDQDIEKDYHIMSLMSGEITLWPLDKYTFIGTTDERHWFYRELPSMKDYEVLAERMDKHGLKK